MGDRRWWRRRRPAARDTAPPLEAGQVWHYRARAGEEDSRVTILLVEQHADFGEVVHVRVEGVRLPNPVVPQAPNTVLGHIPIDGAAFRRSITELVGSDSQDPDLEGFRQWQEAGGGVFTLSIDETIDAVGATLADDGDPDDE